MGLKKLEEIFQKNFSEGLEVGAAVAVYKDGEPLLSLHGGWLDAAKTRPWQAHSPALIWSASKGIASACLLHALQEEKISLDKPVANFWPEFASEGKKEITIAQLLSHRAGLVALDIKDLSLTDHEGVARALANQPPNWSYDGSHGYAPRTFGFLVEELLRRVTNGESLSSYWRRIFADPLDLSLWFGTPEKIIPHVADVIPPKTMQPPSDFTKAFGDPSSLTRRSFAEPGGSLSFQKMNLPEMRTASIASLGAVATADALAKFYSLLISNKENFFTPSTRSLMEKTLSYGIDRVLLTETSFSAGFMTNKNCKLMGPIERTFGHAGAGGALAFADPENNIGFAYIPNAMQPGTLPGERTMRLVEAVYPKNGDGNGSLGDRLS